MAQAPGSVQSVGARGAVDLTKKTTATAESFGAGEARLKAHVAKSLEAVGSDVAYNAANQYIKMERVQDTATAREVGNAAEAAMMRATSAFTRKRGKNVVGLQVEAEGAYNEIRANAMEGLANDRQKEFFASSFDRAMKSSLSNVRTHQDREIFNFDQQTIDANTSALGDTVIAGRNMQRQNHGKMNIKNVYIDGRNDSQAEVEMVQGRDEMIDEMETRRALNITQKMMGHDKVTIDQAIEADRHILHANTLSAFMEDNDPEGAMQYFEQYKDKLDPAMRPKLAKSLKEKVAFSRMLAQVDEYNQVDMSEKDQLAIVRKQYFRKNPELYKQAKELIKDATNDRVRITKAGVKKLIDTQYNGIQELKLEDVSAPGFSYNPPAFMDSANREKLYRVYREKKARLFGEGNKTDYAHRSYLLDLNDTDRDAFKGVDLLDPENYDRLSEKDYRELDKLQREDPDSKGTKSHEATIAHRTIREFVELSEAGENAEAVTKRARFYSVIYKYLDAEPEETRYTTGAVDKVLRKLGLDFDIKPRVGDDFFDESLLDIEALEIEEGRPIAADPVERPDGVPKGSKFYRRLATGGSGWAAPSGEVFDTLGNSIGGSGRKKR